METLLHDPATRGGPDLDAVPDGPAPDLDAPRGRSQRLAVAIVVALLSALFLGNSASWLASGFGESHDGRNAATWASGSQALREDGVVESRFGGRYRGEVYASHPPGIVAETTLAELVGGEHRLVTRAPAWLGSIATGVLLALLLWELGLSAAAIAVGLCTSLSSAMFLVYGTMLDTPVTALPFALAVVWAAQRTIDGRSVRPVVLGILALAVALSGWAAVVIAASQALRLALPAARRRTGWRPVIAIGAGLGAGLAISFAWGLWAYGSFEVMRSKLLDKASSDTFADALSSQANSLRDLLAVGLVLAAAGAVVALVALPDRRWRGPFASVLASIVVYAIALHGGAAMHDYWNYALIVPVAIAVAAGAEALLRRARADRRPQIQRATIVVALVLAALSTTYVSDAEAELVNGQAATRLLAVAEAEAPADGPVVAYLGTRGLESSWIPYESGREARILTDRDALRDLAADEPRFPVLVPWVRYDPPTQDQVRSEAYGVDGPWAVIPAELAAQL